MSETLDSLGGKLDQILAFLKAQASVPTDDVAHEWVIRFSQDPTLQPGGAPLFAPHFQMRAGAASGARAYVVAPDAKPYAYAWTAKLGASVVQGTGSEFPFAFDSYGVDMADDKARTIELVLVVSLDGQVAQRFERKGYLQPALPKPADPQPPDPEPIKPDPADSKAKSARDVSFAEYCEMLDVDASSLPGDVLKELRRAWGGGVGMGSKYSDEELAARKAAFLSGPEPARGTAAYLDFTNPDWRRQSDQINSRLLRPYWDDTPGAWDTIRDCGEPGSGKACIQHGYFYPGGKRG